MQEKTGFKTKEQIGYDPKHPLVRMLLISSHDHDFWYEKPDGTWYGYSKRKDHDPEEWFWEVEGRQMELFKREPPKKDPSIAPPHPKTGQACSWEENNDYMENHYKPLVKAEGLEDHY